MENNNLSTKKVIDENEPSTQNENDEANEKNNNLKLIEQLQKKKNQHDNGMPNEDNEPKKKKGKNDNGEDNNETEVYVQNNDVSKGFLSPPAFHLTEIMHNENCFKKTQGHITVELNGDICIYGGMVENKCINNFIRYVPGINLFEKMRLNSNDIEGRAFCSGNVVTEDNKKFIILFGGITEKEKITDETCVFDFQTKKWNIINNKVNPCPRYKHASFSFENSLYIHGGLDNNEQALSDLWCFSKGMWTEVNQIQITPEARYGHSLVFSLYGNARLAFLFGGNKKCFNGALSDTWIFNINTNRWKEISKTSGCKPCARWGHSAQLFDNEWMIIYGGVANGWIDNYALSDMYALNIYTFTWFEIDISTSKSFNRAYYGSLCLLPYKKSLHIFGGTDHSQECSDAFSLSPLVTYVSYKVLTGKIEQLNDKLRNLGSTSNDNENIDLSDFDTKISELKEEINNISNMMKTFETKFYELEKLNEQCEKILSKDISLEAMEKLEERIRKLELSNNSLKNDNLDN